MKKKIPDYLYIDDFYSNPFEIRERYLSNAEFTYKDNVFYGGISSDVFIDLMEENEKRFSDIVDRNISVLSASCRVATLNDYNQRKSHVHLDKVPFTFLTMLGLPNPKDPNAEFPEYGTNIFRHKRTGISKFYYPSDLGFEEEINKLKMSKDEYIDLILELQDKDLPDTDKWEVCYNFPYKFNRLVFINAKNIFHSGPFTSYGTDIQTGRMTENYFLDYDISKLFQKKAET